MLIPPSAINSGTSPARAFLYFALIVAGLAGNYFKFHIFLNIDFIFGSIFALLAMQFFGVGRGVLAAAIIASYTYILWNHPYAIIIMTAEVASVGWLMNRRKVGMVLADALYWLVIGMPLIYLFYHVAMDVSFSSTFIIMHKQVINSIANALTARLIFTGYLLWLPSSQKVSYREIIYNLLAFFVLFPALIILAITSRSDYTETDRQIRASLLRDRGKLSHRIETWLLNRKMAILTLAEMAGSRSPQQMQPYLELAKKSDINFQFVCLQDKGASTVAIFPLVDELGQNNIGKNFADRQYLPVLKQTLKPMLSEVVMSRFGNPKPTVALIAPLVVSGEFGGYVFGALKLQQLQEYLDKSAAESDLLYTLLDKNGAVIMTNCTCQEKMAHFDRGKGTLNSLDKGISQWVPVLPSNTPPTEQWKKSFYNTEIAIGNLAEWKLMLCQPVAPFQKILYEKYTGELILIFLILLGALTLAELLSRKIVVSLRQLNLLTHEFPDRLDKEDKQLVWPESRIIEASQLISNFREMTESLNEKFSEVGQLNESLEQRIVERTLELQKSRDEWRDTFDSMPDMISILDLNHLILHSNKAMLATMAPYLQGCQPDSPCYKIFHDRDAPPDWCPHSLLLLDGLQHNKQIFEPRLNKHLLVTTTPIHNPGGDLIGSIHIARDISDRVFLEDELAALVQDVESRSRFVESVFTHLHSGIIVLDLDYRISMVNLYVAELCKTPVDQLSGKNLAEICPELYENVLTVDTSDELLAGFCGNRVIIGYSRTNLTDRETNTIGHVLSLKDLTEIIQIRKELRHKERLSAMGEVVARVAHEMRNPLFGMTAAAQILEMELILNESQRDLMDSLLKEARRLNNLVEELLHTTRETRIVKKRVNLIDILDESLLVVNGLFYEKNVSLRKDYSEDVWLSADAERIEQVILNLVKNALEASKAGDHISVEVVITDISVFVIVSDKGEGIPVENLDMIFDVFYTTKKNGTGMGLSICRNIAEAHGGSLTATNNPTGGAEFVMRLPLEEYQL